MTLCFFETWFISLFLWWTFAPKWAAQVTNATGCNCRSFRQGRDTIAGRYLPGSDPGNSRHGHTACWWSFTLTAMTMACLSFCSYTCFAIFFFFTIKVHTPKLAPRVEQTPWITISFLWFPFFREVIAGIGCSFHHEGQDGYWSPALRGWELVEAFHKIANKVGIYHINPRPNHLTRLRV